MQQLEPDFGVFQLVGGGLGKEFAVGVQPVHPRLGGVELVLGAGLCLPGKGGPEISFGGGAFE